MCPVCGDMAETTFVDESVLDLANGFVPARLDVTRNFEGPADLKKLDGFPYLDVRDREGQRVLFRTGMQGPGDMAAFLEDSKRLTGPVPPLDWEKLNGIPERLRRARAAEASGDFKAAVKLYHDLYFDAESTAWGIAAARGLHRIAAEARRVFTEARTLSAAMKNKEAVETLDRAITQFAGTPYGAELRQIRDRLKSEERFPEIAAAD
jgi:hypothetical protein